MQLTLALLEPSPSVARGRAGPLLNSSKNSKANRIETSERSAESGEICSVEVEEK